MNCSKTEELFGLYKVKIGLYKGRVASFNCMISEAFWEGTLDEIWLSKESLSEKGHFLQRPAVTEALEWKTTLGLKGNQCGRITGNKRRMVCNIVGEIGWGNYPGLGVWILFQGKWEMIRE